MIHEGERIVLPLIKGSSDKVLLDISKTLFSAYSGTMPALMQRELLYSLVRVFILTYGLTKVTWHVLPYF